MLRCLMLRFAAPLTLFTVAGATVSLAANCKDVQGDLVEALVSGPACTSPVGLCTVAQMTGALRGEAQFTASAVIPSADTPTTGVIFVTGDSVIANAQLENKRGTILVKNAAAYRTVGDGDLVDVQTITGGTGDFAGATGSLRVTGTFIGATGGTARFSGRVCLP